MKILLLLVAAFCAFGFLATFEPMERSQQLLWRTIYGLGILASVGWVAWAVMKRGRQSGHEAREE